MIRIFIVFITMISIQVNAQFIKDKSINTSIGVGSSYPYDVVDDVYETGFYLQGEYVLTLASWIDIRPYVGLILINSKENKGKPKETNYTSSTNAFLIGGKTRIKAPIPWVAPYIEFGIGTSIGSFKTITSHTNITDNGLILHFPWSVGLELGPKHNFDIAFAYYEHPSARQFSGVLTVGYSFPLD